MDMKKYWIGFNHVSGIGPVRLRNLLDFFGSIEDAWHASALDLARIGLPGSVIESLLKTRQSLDLDRELAWITGQSIQMLTWDDVEYPALLREIEAPPPLLYVRGRLTQADGAGVAVVGTRRATPYGLAVAAEIAGVLAASGVTVISGLARGIDASAHKAALSAGGRTIAVLGSGLDYVYPPEHVNLARKIAARGAVISDYPIGTRPEGRNFPPRNRIISGLSRIVVVVEAGASSGALITASFAADQGRDVFAVPGSIFSDGSLGPHRLIHSGAGVMSSPEDLLEALDLERIREQDRARAELPENEVERIVWQHLGSEPVHVDEIRVKCKLPVQQASAALTMLEMKGRVRQVGAMQYVRIRDGITGYEVNE